MTLCVLSLHAIDLSLHCYDVLQETEQQLELQALCAAALYPRGGAYAEAAVHLLMSLLESSSSSVPPAALRQYAVVAADRQLLGDVAKVAVRLLGKVPWDKQAPQLLARAVQVGL
jgi:hypothetical protein